MHQPITTTADQQQEYGFRCLVCRQHETATPYEACDGCKARMFDEYLTVKGGL